MRVAKYRLMQVGVILLRQQYTMVDFTSVTFQYIESLQGKNSTVHHSIFDTRFCHCFVKPILTTAGLN